MMIRVEDFRLFLDWIEINGHSLLELEYRYDNKSIGGYYHFVISEAGRIE